MISTNQFSDSLWRETDTHQGVESRVIHVLYKTQQVWTRRALPCCNPLMPETPTGLTPDPADAALFSPRAEMSQANR